MNVLIIEDELHASKLLKEMIEQDEDFLVTERLESITESVQYLSKHHQKIDLIFLDIQLADGHSFEIFKHIDISSPVIFCTAYDEYTLQAIKNNGIDYILKPFKEEDILQALNKYKRLVKKLATPIQLPKTNQYQQSFLTQIKDKTIIKYTIDIAFFIIDFETVYFYTFSGEKFPIYKNLEYIESVSNPKDFFRINRQVLLNKKAVISIEPYFNRKIIVNTPIKISEKLIVSRLKVSEFKKWLEQ